MSLADPTGAAALTRVGLGRKTKCRLTFIIFDCTLESQIALREHSKKCLAGSALTPTLISKNDELDNEAIPLLQVL